MVEALGLSSHRACGLVKIHRSVLVYEAKEDSRKDEREALKKLAARYPRYGSGLLHTMM